MEKNIYRSKQKIDSMFSQIDQQEDIEIQSHLARYVCVLISGLLENSLKIILLKYSENKSHPNIQSYIQIQTKNITNLNSEKIEKILSSFSNEWADKFRNEVDEEDKMAIGTIYTNRNRISHGHDVSISYTQVKDYFKNIWRVIEFLYDYIIGETTASVEVVDYMVR